MTMSLEILKPDGPVVQAQVHAVRAIDATGSFGLLPAHQNFCTALVPSILAYRDENDTERYVAVDGGVLVLQDGHVSVVTRDVALSEQLDGMVEAVSDMLHKRQEEERGATQSFNALVTKLLEQMPQLEYQT